MTLIKVGGPIDRAHVSLRMMGDSLIPEEVTRLLGSQPTNAYRKGETIGGLRRPRVAKAGMWRLDGELPETTDLEQQVMALLSRLTPDLAVWCGLSPDLRVDVYCGVFLEDWNRGFSLSPRVMQMLSERGIELGVDIYGVTESLNTLMDSLNRHCGDEKQE